MAFSANQAAPFFLVAVAAWLVTVGRPGVVNRTSDPLVKELDRLSPPDGANTFEPCTYRTKGDDNRLYSCLYRASLSYADLTSAYEKQLLANGWRRYGEVRLYDWGRDLGGKEAFYCKGDLQISLQFSGERSTLAWRYALDASVGVPPHYCSGR